MSKSTYSSSVMSLSTCSPKFIFRKRKTEPQGLSEILLEDFETRKGSSSSFRALSTASSEIPAFLKHFGKVLCETAFHAFLNRIIADRMGMVGIGAFLSKLICERPLINIWYVKCKSQLDPWLPASIPLPPGLYQID